MATKFLERLVTVYGGPTDTKDINGFFSEYVRALGGYSDEALDLAADKMLRERKYKSWPSIGDCWEYAEQASRSLNSAKDRGSKPPISSRPRERDLEALSDNQIAAILKGKGAEWTGRACREGWIVGLHDFVRDRHRLPVADERATLRANSDVVLRSSVGDRNLGILHAGLVRLARAMIERREKLMGEYSQ